MIILKGDYMNRKENTFYIILTDTGTFLTRMIKLYTRKPYNHASISFDSNFKDVYSFGRKTPRNPFIGGFVKEDLTGGVFKQARCAIYSCTATDEQLQKMKSFISRIEINKERYRYNLLGLIAIMMQKQLDRKNAYFCSQFVASVLQEGEVITYDKPLSFIAPHELIQDPNFQLIYEGDLEELQSKSVSSNHISIDFTSQPL